MDPYTEQKLRDEVIYLHSLWHQGPKPPPTVNLQPSNPTRFKKPKKKTPKSNPRKTVAKFSGKEWPVKPPPADPILTPSGWPELKLKPKPQPTHLPTQQELEKLKWNQVQQRALTVAKEFYLQNDENSDEEDENDVVEEEDYDDDMVEDGDSVEDKVYDFVMKVFNEEEGLKEYYLKHCGGGGEFLCLICGGAGEKSGKRFKDCIALVQHSVSIAKTKKRWSHRAFGKVVCEVLGWEIDRLPVSIVLDQKCGDGVVKDSTENVDGESMVCEDITADANVEEEQNKNQVLNEAEGCTGGAVNHLCRNLSSTMILEPVPCDLQTN
ncbi:hypothetical protein HanPI659440_Chr13g0503851 [Helianthus annuus]|nr:hypothetical protein HanPI659440_Chr13g0503851 [Helianthus annuus]